MLDIHPHIQAIKQKHCQPTSKSQHKHQGGKQDVPWRSRQFCCITTHQKRSLRPSRKKKPFSSPPASSFSAASLFLLFFISNVFMPGQKPTGVTCKAHCYCIHTKIMYIFTVNPLCVSKLNKLVFNQYLMFRCINI